MSFEQGKSYRHRRTLDTDLYILEIIDESYEFTIVLGLFTQRKPKDGIFSKNPEQLTIKKSEYKNWSLVE